MALIKKSFILFYILALVLPVTAQTKYWVRFKNKNGTPYSISNPTVFLSPKSVQRRSTYNISIDSTDLPVTPAYVTQVKNVSGVTVLYASKWLNGVVIQTSSASALNTVNSFSFVAGSSPVNRLKVIVPRVEEEPSSALKATASPSFSYGPSRWQARQIGADCIHAQGFRGQGKTIAVMDAGFLNVHINNAFDSLKNRGGILGTRDFVTGGTNVYEDDAHGAMVLSCMAALKPGVMIGTAPLADYWLLRTEDVQTETPSEEYNWIRAVEFSDSVGVDIVTTSLGYTTFDKPVYNHAYNQLDGKTVNMSKVATMAARKGILVLTSAGNEGSSSWTYISVPADADSTCAVGAVDSLGAKAGFSSIGPTPDGRIKPDLMAGGLHTWVIYGGGSAGPASGTSFACPVLAGAMACYWQKHPQLNNIRLIDTLKKTATQYNNPDNFRGWGIPNMCGYQVGLDELASGNGIALFPVPADEILTISSANGLVQAVITISDVTGRELLSQTANGGREHAVFVRNLASGIYILRIREGDRLYSGKIIKR